MAYDTIFSALADPTRRRIFECLADAPQSVTALAAQQPVSRPAVSQHLKVLEQAGLVEAQPRGSHRIYAVRPDGIAEARRYFDALWDEALGAFATEITRQNENR